MRSAMALSAGLHGVILILAIYGLPELLEFRGPSERPIVVELLAVAEKTTPPPSEPEPEPPKEEPRKVEAPEPEPPKPEPVKASPPPPPPEPLPPEPPKPVPVKAPPPPPPPEPEKRLVLVVPDPAPKPEAKPKPKPKPKPKSVRIEAKTVQTPTPKPRAKPRPRLEDFNADQIAALLDKKILKRQVPRPPTPKQPRPETVAIRTPPPRTSRSELATALLTVSERDAIRVQIERCWSVPAGAREAEDLKVRIRIFLNPDGSLRGPPEIVDTGRMNEPGEEFFRAAAESARRAVLRCSPLRNLPVAKYERWRDIELTFDPEEMLGG